MLLISVKLNAQTFCAGFDVVSVTASEFTIDIKLSGSSNFKLGSSNFTFNFNSAALGTPVMVSNNFPFPTYPSAAINEPLGPSQGRFQLFCELGAPGTGITIPASPTYTVLARVKFPITNNTLTSGISFQPLPPLTVVYLDDEMTTIIEGSGCPTLDVVLPIELKSFTATKNKTASNLAWQTASEKGVSHFEVERSQDGNTFAKIGTVKAAGNSADLHKYAWVDVAPFTGSNYYRLKITDVDGKSEYSKVVTLNFDAKSLSAKSYPNPFQHNFSLEVEVEKGTGEVIVELFDLAGKQIYNQKIQALTERLNVDVPTDDLQAGTYLIRIKNGSNIWQHKIIKQ